MRLTSLMVVLAGAVVAGCAGHSVDCTMGNGQTGCAPGTEGYQRMLQQQQDAKTTATIDDARCRSYGAEPGSPAYVACRRKTIADHKSLDPPDVSEAKPRPKSN